MEIDYTISNGHRHAMGKALFETEKANPGVDFSTLHAAMKAADVYYVSCIPATNTDDADAQPLDGGDKGGPVE